MKKKITSLMLNKKSISSFKNTHVLGGGSGTTKCNYYSTKRFCKTDACSSDVYQDCTVTYEACVTEPRFCGIIIQ